MGTITIINLKKLNRGEIGRNDFYVGRANRFFGLRQSALANPYRLGHDSAEDRMDIYAMYKRLLWQWIKYKRADVLFELDQILQTTQQQENVRVLCYCAPLLCHARAVALAIRYFQRQRFWPVSDIIVTGKEFRPLGT